MVKYRIPREELPYNPADRKSIVEYAQMKLEGSTLRKACDTDSYATQTKNKGSLGQAVEYCLFYYEPNSIQEADFPEANLELKTTPLKRNKNNRISAKERLVITMINYCEVVKETWETSHCREKMENILLISYLHEASKNIFDYEIEFVGIQDFSDEDMTIIRDDWNTIVNKVRDGKAHELSSSDTHYLEACTKGASARQTRCQPFSDVPAKPRAFALKSSYMTAFYNKNLSLQAIRRIQGEEKMPFEELVLKRFEPFIGKTKEQLKDALAIPEKENIVKSDCALLTKRILGIEDSRQIEEFAKAGIVVKTIRIEESDRIKESVSFPTFEFNELLAEEDWDESSFCQVCEREFLFVAFKETAGTYALAGCTFWAMPAKDRDAAREVWEETRRAVRKGIKFTYARKKSGEFRMCKDGYPRIDNDLPGSTFNGVAHVRPHASKRAYRLADGTEIGDVEKYASELPDGRAMTKQCFWLNNTYIRAQLKLKGI